MKNSNVFWWSLIITLVGFHASSAQQDIAYLYPGGESCGTWITDRNAQNENSILAEGWVNGYVTGIEDSLSQNYKKSMTVNTDQNGIDVWLDNFCQKNPTTNLLQATMHFINETKPFVDLQ